MNVHFFSWLSMDGFRVVKLEDILPQLDILITATGVVTHLRHNHRELSTLNTL